MLNFTIGPVQMSEEVRKLAMNQLPYFRTADFSQTMFENEALIKKLLNANEKTRIVFITGSGTSGMEASVLNTLTTQDKIIVVNGGSFGQRFVDICSALDFNFVEIKLEAGKTLTEKDLAPFQNKGYTSFLVNLDETSTGVLTDINLVSKFCQQNSLFLIVDAISSFLADPLDMTQSNIDVFITGSQKALALPPGLSIIGLSENAINRIKGNKVRTLYLDLKLYLKDGERGQTPFTPAVGVVLQLNARLKRIVENGNGSETKKIEHIAEDFRKKLIKNKLPLKIFSNSLSSAVTPLSPTKTGISAYSIFEILKNEYSIFVTPSGGTLKEKVFRVGHLGDLTVKDNDTLINALIDLKKRGVI